MTENSNFSSAPTALSSRFATYISARARIRGRPGQERIFSLVTWPSVAEVLLMLRRLQRTC